MKSQQRGMTDRELRELPTMVSLDQSNQALCISRNFGYKLAKNGDYPVPVHRLGSCYRVARADLLRLLGLEVPALDAKHGATA